MDQIKIGNFIAKRRKEENLTQKQLAELLFISEKTVSKWECGKGLPDVSLMLPLCEALKITVNELLLGERVEERAYKENAEAQLLRFAEESKKKYKLFVLCGVLTIISVVSLALLAALVEMGTWARIILLCCALFVAIKGLVAAAALELEAGEYECPKCKHLFKPTMAAYIKGPHTLMRRKLKCPNCGSKKYCKYFLRGKRLSKRKEDEEN